MEETKFHQKEEGVSGGTTDFPSPFPEVTVLGAWHDAHPNQKYLIWRQSDHEALRIGRSNLIEVVHSWGGSEDIIKTFGPIYGYSMDPASCCACNIGIQYHLDPEDYNKLLQQWIKTCHTLTNPTKMGHQMVIRIFIMPQKVGAKTSRIIFENHIGTKYIQEDEFDLSYQYLTIAMVSPLAQDMSKDAITKYFLGA